MKSLMRMFAELDKGVVFYETVISLKHQKHTFIECVPLPWEQFDEIPAYFRVCILSKHSVSFKLTKRAMLGIHPHVRSRVVAEQEAD